MKKRFWWLPVVGVVFLLAACHGQSQPVNPARTSRHMLQRAETIWVQTAGISGDISANGKTSQVRAVKLAAGTTPDVVISHHAAIGNTSQKTTLAQAKKLTAANAAYKASAYHWVTLADVNQALKAAKVGVQLRSLKTLAVYRSNLANTLGATGYVATKRHLVALTLLQNKGEHDMPLATVYATGQAKTPAKGVTAKALQGTWSSANGTGASDNALRVAGNWVYHVRTTPLANVTRDRLQTTAKLTAKQLYTTAWQQAQTQAAALGYVMPKARTVAASEGQTIELFLSAKTMVAIGKGSVVTYHKVAATTPQAADTKIPAGVRTVFAAFDRQQSDQAAIAVSALNSSEYEVVLAAPNMLTDGFEPNLRTYQFAGVSGTKVRITDTNP